MSLKDLDRTYSLDMFWNPHTLPELKENDCDCEPGASEGSLAAAANSSATPSEHVADAGAILNPALIAYCM